MTSRAGLLLFLIFTLILTGIATRQGMLVALSLPLIIYLSVGFFYSPPKIKLSVNRDLDRAKVFTDVPMQSHLTLQNEGDDLEEMEIDDPMPLGLEITEGKKNILTAMLPGEKVDFTYRLKGMRGEYIFTEVKARAVETFGLFYSSESIPAFGRIAILPDTIKLRPIPIRPPQTRGFAGPIPSRQGGAGVNFLLVREYQPGDSLRQVNWKVSARSDHEIYTTTYELERIADVGIILDARQQIDVRKGNKRIFEHMVRAAGGLADLFLQDGNRVGLLVYGAAITSAFPGTGKLQRERILQVLAKAETGFSYALEKLDYLPTRFFPPRSQIILVSPLIYGDAQVLGYLRQQGYAVMVISPNSILFEAEKEPATSIDFLALKTSLHERRLLINLLRRQGVQVIDWDITTPLEPLVRTAAMAAVRRPMGETV